VLEWRTARAFLYWRLRRRLLEDQVKQEVLRASAELSHDHVQSMLRRWFVESEGAVKVRTGLGLGDGGHRPAAAPI
jgi:acetyl-CoA carboxylase/biotin carboxylase 2